MAALSRRSLLSRGRALALAALLGAAGARAAVAQPAPDAEAEYALKAAFLVKIPSFVDWPPAAWERADAPLVIGVAAPDPVVALLRHAAEGRAVAGHPIVVRPLGADASAAGLHVLFVVRSEAARLAGLLPDIEGRPVLVVTEADGALPPASMVNFVVADDRVRFDVFLPPAERAGLRISARLLAVARVVQRPAS